MECSCPECRDVSMAVLAAGMLSVKTLHPVALVITSWITKSSASTVITFPDGALTEVI